MTNGLDYVCVNVSPYFETVTNPDGVPAPPPPPHPASEKWNILLYVYILL